MTYPHNNTEHRTLPTNAPGRDHFGHRIQSLIIADNQGIKSYCTIYNNSDYQ